MMNFREEAGAALLSVLLLVAVMSVAAVAMLELTLGSVQRAKMTDAQTQVNWLVAGAEEAGLVGVTRLLDATEGRLTDLTPQFQRPTVTEVAGGQISTVLEDATNCFNLNALAADGATPEEQLATAALFKALLVSLRLNENEIDDLTAALQDWLDADNSPRLRGAEDSYYASLDPAYRTANTPMLSVAELRAVRGFSADLYKLLAPMLCTRRDGEIGALNINTLNTSQAPLLAMMFSGELEVARARDILNTRPPGGWASVDAMMEDKAIERIASELRRFDLLSLQSTHIRLRGKIEAQGDVSEFQTLYTRRSGQQLRVVSRTYGAVL